MNTVSNTAYYCCGIRMEDANKEHSVCNDVYAERFMDETGRQIFAPFRSETMPNISNITRCRLIDEFLTAELNQDNRLNIVSIGAGFDTRPYRLTGGNWLEIDEPQIIGYKNEKLPVEECSNPLRRVAINFEQESLADKLTDIDRDGHTVFVIEGVFMYLLPAAIETTIKTLQRLFPQHVLYCDLMTKQFFTRFAQSVHEKLVASGGTFTERPDHPEELFLQSAYKMSERVPMFVRARELGLLWNEVKIPSFSSWLLLNLFMKDLNGYAVHRFQFDKAD